MRFVHVHLTALLCAAGARAETPAESPRQTYAVLAIDEQANPAGKAASASAAVRDALRAQGVAVLDAKETSARLAAPRGVGGYELASLQRRLAKAEEAHAALDPKSSITILEGVIDDLSRDPDFTAEKQRLLEDARLRLATRLVATAGAKETGAQETPEGKRAALALVEALRANPTLTLDEARFPPKMRRLLQGATEAVKRLGLGPLTVLSRPAGARVFLEGREIGAAPLKLGPVIARGRYRVWAELDGIRSVTQPIEIGERSVELSIDLQFEGALWPEGPGLRPLAGTAIDEDVAKKVGRFVDVDQLLLVGISDYDGGEWLYAATFSVRTSSISRRGAVRVGGETQLSAAASELAAFLSTGASSRELSGAPVPAQVLPMQKIEVVRADDGTMKVIESPPAEEPPTVEGSEFPWLAVGIGVGATAAVLAAAGITTAVLVMTAPRAGVVTGRVEVLE